MRPVASSQAASGGVVLLILVRCGTTPSLTITPLSPLTDRRRWMRQLQLGATVSIACWKSTQHSNKLPSTAPLSLQTAPPSPLLPPPPPYSDSCNTCQRKRGPGEVRSGAGGGFAERQDRASDRAASTAEDGFDDYGRRVVKPGGGGGRPRSRSRERGTSGGYR